MESLVKEILSVSKLELKVIDDMKPISVTDILKHTCERLYPLAEEKKITIHQQITEQDVYKRQTLTPILVCALPV